MLPCDYSLTIRRRMYMKLTDPNKLRQLYAEKQQWYTIEEIAKGLEMSTQTISNAFRGQAMRPKTVRKFAEPLRIPATEIATFIND